MDEIDYLEWFTNELEDLFNSYLSSHGDEKEGRKSGIKNFLAAQKDELEKIISIKDFKDGGGITFSWNHLIEPYFFDNDIKAFIEQLKFK